MVDVSFFRRIYTRIYEDDVPALAAQLAYFLLLSLFPLLIFLVSLLPYLPLTNQDIIAFIQDHTPVEQAGIINTSVEEVLNKNTKVLSFSIIATLWSASNGINAIVRAFNKAYRVDDTRTIKARLKSMLLTIAMIFVFVLALLLPVFGKEIGEFLFSQFGLRSEFLSFWEALRWLLSFFVLFLVFTFLYWIAPNIKMKCRHALPGAFISTVGWVVVSWGFSFYVSNFAQYTVIYGQIGGVIVLLIWLYLAAFIIIIGGEINAYVNEQKKVC
ncbi:YihY/virulence factor BrkB family protein [Mesobacillus maritimus]|uniref:YihY/virulence factor BrkB family protein n=1 Tax=Mesobacillus maritimus TaxID=1643336 RepID=UPI0020418474|nr:YihY/virulence factor BrkB family protein [Mesobacillus maritimus]MCM3669800.1 YihY/virulence factor BrkB family protein [Mesobacillus maritimus]